MATIRDRYILEVDTEGGVRGIANATAATGRLGGALRGIGPLAAAAGSALAAFGAVGVASELVNQYTEYERLNVQLQTYLGSQEAATAEMERLRSLAKELPQDLNDVASAFTILTRNGIDTSSESLTAFANIAAANSKSLEQLAEAVADGLTGEFERFKEFGIKVSKEGDNFVATMGDQQVAISQSTTDLIEQLMALGEEGGRFGDAAINNANTLSQSFSNLRGAVFETAIAFGEGIKPGLQDAAGAMEEFLNNNEETIQSIGRLIGDGITALINAIDALLNPTEEMSATFENLSIFFENVLKPAFTGLVEIFSTIIDASMQVNEALQPLYEVLFPAIGEAIEFVTGVITTLITGFADLITGVADAITSAENFRDAVTGAFTAVKDVVVNTVSALVTNVIDLFQGLYDALWGNSIIRDLIDGIIEGFTNLGPRVLEVVRAMINGLISTFGELFTAIVDGIGGAIDRGLEKLSQAFTDFKNFFFGEEDEVVQAASETRAALEDALSAENLTAEAVGLTSEELESLAENLNNLVDPINQHQEALETSTELYEGLTEQIDAINEKLSDYSDTVDELNELQQDQLDNQDELNELYEDFNEYLEQTNEFLTARIDLSNSLNNLVSTEIANISSLNDLYEINLDRIDSINEGYEQSTESLSDLAELYPQINESIDQYNRGLGLLIERTADATVETQRLTQAMREVAEASAQAQRAAESARASIASAASAQRDFDFQQSTSAPAPQTSTGSPFSSIFDGFFANGGFINSGRFGVVGERGPELVTGPANVTPLDDLGTTQNITYNINAVDVRSFKQLVAQDPEFIHAVAQKGARSTPVRRL